MSKNIPKIFESQKIEENIYRIWEESELANPEKLEEYLLKKQRKVKKPFTIILPPPNANGNLHLGHMCGYSYHDVLARYRRMTNHPTLLVPGKDHAGIQTETAFTKILQSRGENKWDMGRDEFYKRCYEFCIENADNARKQEKRIGLSADYSREFFTLDSKLTKIVYDTFYKMYKEGLVYRDKRIVNQCPNCKTALADVDTEYEERRGIFAYIKYPFVDEDGKDGIVVATTRPETMLGDTAIAINPKDERYKQYIGHKVLIPIADREIPIIADEDVDMELGTGAVKVTPAHSPIDFEIGKKHNLDIENVIDTEGKMTGNIPEKFKGMTTIDCSKALCNELENLGLLEKIENIKHEVSICERCKTIIEPIISNQWYLDVSKLAQEALKIIKSKNIRVIPFGQQKSLEFFFEHIQPWCISRQLWWGQRIPVWYSGGKELCDWLRENKGKSVQDFEIETGKRATGTGEIRLGEENPGQGWEEETDVFDTWFSSGQLPYSTLGGIGSDDYVKYYPTQVMIHARDILFWWSARMIMFGLYNTGNTPFSTIFLTGLILASDGSKMSKSKENGIEPSEVFEKYGADSLRLWYYSDALPGSNAPIREEKIRGNRNFVNKIWNASRFILMNIDDSEIKEIKECRLEETARMSKTKSHILQISKYIEKYQFNLGVEAIREFFWHQLCDIWIEEIKTEIRDEEIGSDIRIRRLAELLWILKENLKIMHPFIPFVTEAVWQELVKLGFVDDLLMVEQI